jgi:hypothetical protein
MTSYQTVEHSGTLGEDTERVSTVHTHQPPLCNLCNLIIFSNFTESCSHHCNLGLECLCHPNSSPRALILSHHPDPQPKMTANLISTYLPFLEISDERAPTMCSLLPPASSAQHVFEVHVEA